MTEEIIKKIEEWLEANINEHSLSEELREDNVRLKNKIQEWKG
tara:strand:- start:773 stop:901 length:129 start_codon:yes stop_codon:yes gene_type:complete